MFYFRFRRNVYFYPLLANLFQGSRSTLSCVSFPSVFAFQEDMWATHISAFLDSPTVPHEPELSTTYGNSGLFSAESPMSLALTTTYENSYFRRNPPWVWQGAALGRPAK
jgi:hypothetical protein